MMIPCPVQLEDYQWFSSNVHFFLFEDVDDDYEDADDQEEDGYGDIYGSGVVKTDTVDSW